MVLDADKAPLGPYGFVNDGSYVSTESQRNEQSPEGSEAVEGRPILNKDDEEIGFVPVEGGDDAESIVNEEGKEVGVIRENGSVHMHTEPLPNPHRGGACHKAKDMEERMLAGDCYFGTDPHTVAELMRNPFIREFFEANPDINVVDNFGGKHELICNFFRKLGYPAVARDKFYPQPNDFDGFDSANYNYPKGSVVYLTNPPFVRKDKALELAINSEEPYVLFVPQDIFCNMTTRGLLEGHTYYTITGFRSTFMLEDGSFMKVRSVGMWIFGNFPFQQDSMNLTFNVPRQFVDDKYSVVASEVLADTKEQG